MTNLNLTDRQITIISIALTNLYDEIAKSGEGSAMRDDIMELSKYIQQQYQEAQKREESGWSLVRYSYDGDHKVYETLYKGTQFECSKYGFDTFGNDIGMCLLDPQKREWDL
jgi:hypothetical protein